MANILVLNGPNLNLLGTREPELYGQSTIVDIEQALKTQADNLGHQIQFIQSNSEAELINHIHTATHINTDFIIFNPAAYTHTSIALRDALLAVNIPLIEVHLSNIFQREEFRQISYFSDIAIGIISGLGAQGYELALSAADRYLNRTSE